MQSSLETPTDEATLPQRIHLAQCWTDLMLMEGFTSLPRSWNPWNENLAAYMIRRRVNAALRKEQPSQACHLLDSYLQKLGAVSRWWYADGSPGNILQDQWIPISRVDGLEVGPNALRMRCAAGDRAVTLSLVLPATGGVRVFGDAEGSWRPGQVLPLRAVQTPDGCSVESNSGTIVVRRSPFLISLRDAAGGAIMEIGPGALAFRFGPNGAVLAVDFRNQLDPGEVIYGFGERYDRFNQVGTVLTLWGIDDWVGNGIGMRNTTYKPLPIFHSSKGYMVFSNSSYRLRADIGKTNPNQYRLTQHGPILDLYLWIGAPEKSLESYTALTGRPPVPPRWALEPWIGRGGDAWANGPLHDAVEEEKNTIARFAELDIPHSAIYAEGPSANSAELHEFASAHGIRVLSYFMPAVGGSRQQSLMPELKLEELPVLHCARAEETGELGYVDFSNPNAMELCRRAWKPALDLGVAGSMVDYGDLVPDDAVFHDGMQGDEAHNFYSYAYHRTMSEVWRERRGDDFILFGRAAAPGTQRWVGQFAGDHPGNFPGMRAVVTGALNLCACGFSTWGSDIGGYFGLPEPTVFARWTQLGCFSPLMRPHGKTPRDPWHFGEAMVKCYKFYAWVRENLLDYIYAAAVVAHHQGTPIMRAMPVAFPGDPSVAAAGDQYMFGKDLLVAPVMSEDGCRTVSFPSGVWTCLWEGRTVRGPVDLRITAPLSRIPVYLRQSAVVLTQLDMGLRFGESMSKGHVHALVVTPPGSDESVTVLTTRNEAGRVTVRSRGSGCEWRLENLPEISHVLLYGAGTAAALTLDGHVLPRKSESRGTNTGWYAEDGNRLVIYVPPVETRRPTRTLVVDR
jgi:alpha-glucosidase (family GH31 glycosyl hydrolase)